MGTALVGLVCVSTRGRSRFPSVLLQPLGHLSVQVESTVYRRAETRSTADCVPEQIGAFEHARYGFDSRSVQRNDAMARAAAYGRAAFRGIEKLVNQVCFDS